MELSLPKRDKERPRQPGYEGKREIAPVLIEVGSSRGDPVIRPAIRNLRESSLTWMHARGYIDDAELRAGEWFRATYERTRMGSMVVDPSKEPVDTSGIADPIPDRVMIAGQELAAARKELGKPGFILVEMVCGQGLSVRDATLAASGVLGQGGTRFTWELFRLSLNVLASWKGYATNGRRK